MSNRTRGRQVAQSQPKEEVKLTQNEPLETVSEENTQENLETLGIGETQETQVEQRKSVTLAEETVVTPEVASIQPKTEGFTPVFKVELDLNNYAEAMDAKKVINPEEGGRWQYSLFTLIKNILGAKNQEEFNKEWNTVLVYFNKNKDTIFNEKFIFRFPEQWPGSAKEFTTFRRLVYTIIQTADHKTRKKAIIDINLNMVCENLTEQQRTFLINFYGV